MLALDSDLNTLKSLSEASEVDNMKLVNALKRLNERKREFERQGLTNDVGYKNLDRLMKALPHNSIEYANGEVRYYAKESTKNLTPSMAKRVVAVNNNPRTTVSSAKKEARQLLKARGIKPTKEALKKQIQMTGDLHDFIEHHTDAYYGIPHMAEAVRRRSPDAKLHKDEEAEFYDLMERYETDREAVEQQARDWRNTQGWE